MIYQLPNGKTINISLEAYLSMSDDDLKYLNEMNIGSSACDNPFISPEELDELDIIMDDDSEIDNTDEDVVE